MRWWHIGKKHRIWGRRLAPAQRERILGYINEHLVVYLRPAACSTVREDDRQACYGAAPVASMPCPSVAAKAVSLEEMLKQADAGFTEKLLQLIDRSGRKDSHVYRRAGLTKQHFSKIRNNPHYRPTKATAVALAVALELDEKEMRDLIGRAGYTLSNSCVFDVIIRYFLEQGIYDRMEINMALYEFDQPLLGQ